MGLACDLGPFGDLLQLVVPEKLRAPVVEIHIEGAVGRVSPPPCDRPLLATPVRRAMVRPDPHPLANLRLFGKHLGSSFSLPLSLGSERIRILHEYSWRGAEDSNCFARLLLHIRSPVYVSCST